MVRIFKLDCKKIILVAFLILGAILKVYTTSCGNFIFNTDNARDILDIRSMVVFHNFRLIGPTSGIEGLYDGPAWYYMLSIPYYLSNGDPYSLVLFQILLWFIGGVFLIKLAQKWGFVITLLGTILWVGSSIVSLATSYAFNPSPVLLLMPLFFYLLLRYIETNRLIFISLCWLLTGLFFNFEMVSGGLVAITLLLTLLVKQKLNLFKNKDFWIGLVIFSICLAPQALFDFRHNFIMTKSFLTNTQNAHNSFNLNLRIMGTRDNIMDVLTSAFLHTQRIIIYLSFLLSIMFLLQKKIYKRKQETLVYIAGIMILVFFAGFVLLPLNAMPWHIEVLIVPVLLMSLSTLYDIFSIKRLKIIGFVIFFILLFSAFKELNFSQIVVKDKSSDPANYANQLDAVNFVYNQANNTDFSVYIYIPSVYDYQFQYLFWWYGQKQYGYLPIEYAYLPNVPEYISDKSLIKTSRFEKKPEFVFLIQHKSRSDLLGLWKNNFNKNSLVSIQEVGPFIIEKRKTL